MLILKPLTYMNESGRAVAEAQRFFKIPISDVTVFYDEIDLPPAKLRVKIGGGNAGHNGFARSPPIAATITGACGSASAIPATRSSSSTTCSAISRRPRRPGSTTCATPSPTNAALLAAGEDASFQNKIHLALEARGWTDVKRPGERATNGKE